VSAVNAGAATAAPDAVMNPRLVSRAILVSFSVVWPPMPGNHNWGYYFAHDVVEGL
jgi:hypothetical protein